MKDRPVVQNSVNAPAHSMNEAELEFGAGEVSALVAPQAEAHRFSAFRPIHVVFTP